jgi:hypothetical protein
MVEGGPHRASTSPPSGAKSDWHTHAWDAVDDLRATVADLVWEANTGVRG